MPDPVTLALVAVTGGLGTKVVEYFGEGIAELIMDAKEHVPEDQQVENPNPSFVGPLLEAAKYHTERGLLRDMFCELLAKGMDAEQQDKAHPAFVRILEQLSSDEAILLQSLNDEENRDAVFQARVRVQNSGSFQIENVEFSGALPELNFPQHLELYVSHLEQLNLLQRGIPYEPKNRGLRQSTTDDLRTAEQGVISFQLSRFGTLFVEACVPKVVPEV